MMQIVPRDRLSSLFAQFRPSARTFFAGNLCRNADFGGGGHVHLFKGGILRLTQPSAPDLTLVDPTVLFFPRGQSHKLVVDPVIGADLACAYVDFGAEEGNLIAAALPEIVIVALNDNPIFESLCTILWREAFTDSDGKQEALDILFEYFLILLVRHVIVSGSVSRGMLAGLGDIRIAKALTAMHDAPSKVWTLDDLADLAGMSRTRFAAHFKAVVGKTAVDYLGSWRMVVAQGLLGRGKSVKLVANRVGYDSSAAFARAFTRYVGLSPRAWLARQSRQVSARATALTDESGRII